MCRWRPGIRVWQRLFVGVFSWIHRDPMPHDRTIESTLLGIWRQEQPGDPFVRLNAVLELEIDEANADLTGFSRYALAY